MACKDRDLLEELTMWYFVIPQWVTSVLHVRVCVCVCVWSGKGKNREMMSDDDISIFKAYLFKKKQPTIYTCHTNNNSEQVIGINVKCKTIKLLEDNIEESR